MPVIWNTYLYLSFHFSELVLFKDLVHIPGMEQEEFSLKWNNYPNVFHGAFLSVLHAENFTDITLFCDSPRKYQTSVTNCLS